MTRHLNNEHVCGVCRRRAAGLAVGRPGKTVWYCDECGPQAARELLDVSHDRLDAIEQAAIAMTLAELPDRIVIEPEERLTFGAWWLRTMAQNLRKAARDGYAPF
jgi:hypothetical protein